MTKATNNKKRRPNVIIILVDDLGVADVSYSARRLSNGVAPAIETPHLDALATYEQASIQMTNAFTHMLCGPSRAALVTARLAHKLGNPFPMVEGGSLPPKYKTIGHEFQRRGYSNHFVGKWGIDFPKPSLEVLNQRQRTAQVFNGKTSGMGPTNRGFDTFYGLHSSAHNHFTKEVVYKGMVDWHRHNQTHKLDYPEVDHEPNEYSTHLFTREAIRIIQQWAKKPSSSSSDDNNKPGFLHLSYTAPHDPLQAPDEYLERPSCKRMQNWRRKTFCGMVSAIDDGVGQIVHALEHERLADNTIILFSTDNGGAPAVGGFNYPYRGQKGTIYEGGFRTPAFLHVPGAVVKNALYENTIHLVDFAPTLLGIVDRVAGETEERLGKYEDLGEGIDGKDHTKWMLQSLAGQSLEGGEDDEDDSQDPPLPQPPRQSTVLEYNVFFDHTAYLEGEWKLLLGHAGRSELFVEPKGKYYDNNGRPRFVLEELASDVFDRGLGENWFLYGWAMRFGVDAIINILEGQSEKARNRVAFQVETGIRQPFNATLAVTEERLPRADFSGCNPREIQLYNIKNDPYETDNVALANRELVESMVTRLREEVKDDPGQYFAVQKQFISRTMPELFLLIAGFIVVALATCITLGCVVWSSFRRRRKRKVKTS